MNTKALFVSGLFLCSCGTASFSGITRSGGTQRPPSADQAADASGHSADGGDQVVPPDDTPQSLKKYALIFQNQPGPTRVDFQVFDQVLADPRVNFDVKFIDGPTVQEMTTLTAETARKADVLVWVFSGHGGEDGSSVGTDRDFFITEMIDAIRSARTKPLKRLEIFVETCYSGTAVNGKTQIVTEVDAEIGSPVVPLAAGSLDRDDMSGVRRSDLYDEAFIFASTTKYEVSASATIAHDPGSITDLNDRVASWFVSAMEKTLKGTSGVQDPKMSLREFIAETGQNVRKIGLQTPVYAAYPKSILDGCIFTSSCK